MTDNRDYSHLRPLEFTPDISLHAEGSCLAAMGHTRVLCTATVEDRVPPFLEGSGRGWITAEYGMLPRSTHTRQQRERGRNGASGRALEIGRLIGRALRMTVDPVPLAERTITLDCDVIQADGGTRCCAINGAVVALYRALEKLQGDGVFGKVPFTGLVAAVSVGILEGKPALDLDYRLDSSADVDLNVVMTEKGGLVEVQGTAEHAPFSRADLDSLLDLAARGIEQIFASQRKVLGL